MLQKKKKLYAVPVQYTDEEARREISWNKIRAAACALENMVKA